FFLFFFFSSRRRHTRFSRDWSSDVCSSDLVEDEGPGGREPNEPASDDGNVVTPHHAKSLRSSIVGRFRRLHPLPLIELDRRAGETRRVQSRCRSRAARQPLASEARCSTDPGPTPHRTGRRVAFGATVRQRCRNPAAASVPHRDARAASVDYAPQIRTPITPLKSRSRAFRGRRPRPKHPTTALIRRWTRWPGNRKSSPRLHGGPAAAGSRTGPTPTVAVGPR